MTCEKGHEMFILEEFALKHEESDTPRDTESLRFLEENGIELGADVVLWYCKECDYARAEFEYPGGTLSAEGTGLRILGMKKAARAALFVPGKEEEPPDGKAYTPCHLTLMRTG